MKNKPLLIAVAPWIVIIAILIWFTQCQKPKPCPEAETKTDTIVTVDTIQLPGKTVYKPVPYEVIDTFTISPEVDTAKILAEYIKLRKYQLPISDDSNSKIDVFAEVQYNRIEKWSYDAQIYPRTTVIEKNHVLIPEKRNKLVAGLILGVKDSYYSATPVFGLKTKKDNVMLFGYDIVNGVYTGGYVMSFGKK